MRNKEVQRKEKNKRNEHISKTGPRRKQKQKDVHLVIRPVCTWKTDQAASPWAAGGSYRPGEAGRARDPSRSRRPRGAYRAWEAQRTGRALVTLCSGNSRKSYNGHQIRGTEAITGGGLRPGGLEPGNSLFRPVWTCCALRFVFVLVIAEEVPVKGYSSRRKEEEISSRLCPR